MLRTKDRRFVSTKRVLAQIKSQKQSKYKRILTENCTIGFPCQCNMNTFVLVEHGIDSANRYILPNILYGNTSFFVVDVKGELLYSTRNYLEDKGYRVIVYDFVQEPELFPDIEDLLTAYDKLTAVFFVIPVAEAPYLGNIISSLFDTIYRTADEKQLLASSYHVHFMFDEFALLGKIKGLQEFLSFAASHNTSVSICVAFVSQMEALYSYDIPALCDIVLIMGIRSSLTTRYLCNRLGLFADPSQALILVRCFEPCLDHKWNCKPFYDAAFQASYEAHKRQEQECS